MEKLCVSAYKGHLQVLTTFLLKEFYIINTLPPNIGSYKIPQLQSQFPPNPTPTQPERSTPATYKSIAPTDIPPDPHQLPTNPLPQ